MELQPPSADTFFESLPRVTRWQTRNRLLEFGRRPLLMGILNCTPDSFSDGGKYFDPEEAIDHGLEMVAEGADLLDIGGESTRPYSEPVSAEEERKRVVPVIEELAKQVQVPISIDTSKAEVAEACLAAGAEIINDVTGLEGDPRMLEVAKVSKAGVCVMHMQGTPQTMQDHPTYQDVVAEIEQYLLDRRELLLEKGLELERICLDPGIGFGKTHQHNLTLLAHVSRFHRLGCPLLVGHSRKGFIGKVLNDKQADRTWGTVATSLALARQGVQILRVHDIQPHREALLLFEAAGGIDGQTIQVETY
ncbi:Dihydropteroate synthase [Planctomycetales bacterium 10988]|nr:Dihydropteroate synthase [Planctomycetales bacterium 10988]